MQRMRCYLRFLFVCSFLAATSTLLAVAPMEKQVTSEQYGHILTNVGVWSPDGQWIVYDVRSDPAGDLFDGSRIERVHVESGAVEALFESKNAAHCGVATCSPKDDRVVFIHGPENPSDDWQYASFHRRGVFVDAKLGDKWLNLDARDVTAPFTVGALRGGTHVHTFSGDGQWVSFTYEDHVLQQASQDRSDDGADLNQRNVGVSVPVRKTEVPKTHDRNHDGSHFSVLATRTVNQPQPGSDEISRAFSDAWIGSDGYRRTDGLQQSKALAFQGHVRTKAGETISEVFVVDLPDEVTRPSDSGPLQGTTSQRPQPPSGTIQRRLTFTEHRKYQGIQGVRHWLRSSPDGSMIAFLMKDDAGISQLWTISPNGGDATQLTRNNQAIGSAFTWSPDGTMIAHGLDNSVCVTTVADGETIRLTKSEHWPLRPEACVFSPDGSKIAYVRQVEAQGETWNQIFVLDLSDFDSTRR